MIGWGFMWKSEDMQGFFPVRSECQADVPRTRFKSRVGKTLSRRRWHAAFTKDGHLDMERVLRRIQRGVSLYLHLNLFLGV